eukprot:56522-Eustigmatos_ZCMA.PRE.2
MGERREGVLYVVSLGKFECVYFGAETQGMYSMNKIVETAPGQGVMEGQCLQVWESADGM